MKRRHVITIVSLLSIGLGIWLWVLGSEYYTTNPWERPDFEEDATMRSSGIWGHGLGLVGTLLILINLTFLLRRHVKAFRRLGKLRTWLDFHVITGLLGPLLILYHTAFHPRTTVAIAAGVCLIVLVITGIIGRFIYSMVPHTVAGAEVGREGLQSQLSETQEHLLTLVPPTDPLWRRIDALSQPPLRVPKSKLGSLVMLPWFNVRSIMLRLQVGRVSREFARTGHMQGSEAVADIRQIILVRQRLHTLDMFRSLMRWWRGFHRWFAIVMVVATIVHVGVVLYFGYLPEVTMP